MGRLVRSIAAIVIRVAVPRFLDAPSVLAGEFRVSVARAGMTNGRIFIRAVTTIVVAVAFPRSQDTAAGRIALEFVLRARNVAVLFIRSVAAVIYAIAECRGRGAVVILTLELSGFTESFQTRTGLVRSVLTIFFSVAFPVERNATVVFASATMLSF